MTSLRTLIVIVFLCLNHHSRAQETNEKYPETVVIKMIEVFGSAMATSGESRMLVCKPDMSIEKIDLYRVNTFSSDDENISFNLKKLRQQIQIWHNQGFEVKSHGVSSANSYFMISTIILQKN